MEVAAYLYLPLEPSLAMDIREETGGNGDGILQNQGVGWIKKRDRFRSESVYC